MSERDQPGLLVIGLVSNESGEQVIVEQGNDEDIEATKQQARALVYGSPPRCFQSWIVNTVFSAISAPPAGAMAEKRHDA